VDALRQVEGWGVGFAAAGVTRAGEVVATHGDTRRVARLASVSKLVTSLTFLVAAEEGTIDLDEPAGPPGSTVRHLLAHASGLPFEGHVVLGSPGRRRIYSNEGFRVLGEHLAARAEMPFATYVRGAVVEPLRLELDPSGHPGAGMHGNLDDLLVLGGEFLAPTLVSAETFAEAVTVQFPGLSGVLPGFGRQATNDWGLGFDLKDGKAPHWTGELNAPSTFGHFGGSGTFLWVDPVAGVACACLTEHPFGDWAKEAWPRLSDRVLTELED
jgi:CubicO group peptidase (beta-lactamase class C family)